jgi:tetratricopeptide (TPR) repeat protein
MKKLAFTIFILIFLSPRFLSAMSIEEGIIDPGLKKAWEMIKTDHPLEAIKLLDENHSGLENRIYYHFCYGRALERIQKPTEAMDHYRLAYLYAPKGELKEAILLERAEGYLRIRNYSEAKIVYGLFLTEFKQSKFLTRAHSGMAQCLTALGLLSEALQHYEKAGEGLEALSGKAMVLHRLGRVKEADEVFSKAIAKDKVSFLNSEALLFYYGENLQEMGKDREALPYLSSTIKDPILKKKADIALGLIALKARKFEEAQKYFYSALSSSDRSIRSEALYRLAESYLEAGKSNEAVQALLEYRSKYPWGKYYDEALLKLARLDLEGERFDQAGRWIRELVLRSQPRKETLTELEGLFLKLKEKDPAQMISLWNTVGYKFLNSSREPFLSAVGDVLKGSGRPYLELLRWLAKNGSEKVKIRSLINLVQYQAEAGNSDAAMADLKSLKNYKVAGDRILRLEAIILHARMDYGGAVERLLALKKIEIQDLPLLEDTLTSAKDVNKALVVYEKNLRQLGGNANNYIKIADLLYEKGKKKEALQYYQKALEKDSLNEWVLFRSGSLMAGEEAEKRLSKVRDGNSILSKLARASLKEKEIERKMGDIF